MPIAKKVILAVIVAIIALTVILFRVSIKRIYEAMIKPVVTKVIGAFKVGL